MSAISLQAGTAAPQFHTRAQRAKAIAAITLGNGLEFFDFTVYSFFASLIGAQYFPVHGSLNQLLFAVGSFGVGFFMRPLGGVVIGAFADRAGRKAAMMLTLSLMALGSAIIAFTPPYARIGVAAPTLIVSVPVALPSCAICRRSTSRRNCSAMTAAAAASVSGNTTANASLSYRAVRSVSRRMCPPIFEATARKTSSATACP